MSRFEIREPSLVWIIGLTALGVLLLEVGLYAWPLSEEHPLTWVSWYAILLLPVAGAVYAFALLARIRLTRRKMYLGVPHFLCFSLRPIVTAMISVEIIVIAISVYLGFVGTFSVEPASVTLGAIFALVGTLCILVVGTPIAVLSVCIMGKLVLVEIDKERRKTTH